MKLSVIALAATLALGALTGQVQAKIVIEGRSAQALNCAAIQFSAMEVLFSGGLIDNAKRDAAQEMAVQYLQHVPGTRKQRMRAMRMRLVSLNEKLDLIGLLEQWEGSQRWCERNFS
ncbi:MAG: hypothetical protein AAFQ66_18360 [Pseudomonadota bacterium]